MPMTFPKLIVVISACLAFSACAVSEKTVFEGEPKSDAEVDYRRAVKELEDGAREDSIKAFHNIKLKYPYATRWATLSDLRIADAHRAGGDYALAAVSYQDFIRTYPAHQEIPYAAYQVANCYFELMPSDLFFLPNPWQRDRKTTQQAESALKMYLSRFPNDANAVRAREQLDEVSMRLANHELYVAEYYFKQKAYQGSVERLKGLVKTYPDAAVTARAFILLAHSYLKLNDPIEAKAVLQQLIDGYPQTEEADQARAWIARNVEVP